MLFFFVGITENKKEREREEEMARNVYFLSQSLSYIRLSQIISTFK